MGEEFYPEYTYISKDSALYLIEEATHESNFYERVDEILRKFEEGVYFVNLNANCL